MLVQGNFTSSVTTLDAYHFGFRGLTLDADGRLWVNDASNNRLLRFDHAADKINGATVDGVLGQIDFLTDRDGGSGPDGVFYCTLLTEPGGRLWLDQRRSGCDGDGCPVSRSAGPATKDERRGSASETPSRQQPSEMAYPHPSPGENVPL